MWRATNISHGSSATSAIRARSGSSPATRSTWNRFSAFTPILPARLLNGASPDDFRSASDFRDATRWIPERRIRFSAGWGTLLTNDFRNCNPQGDDGFNPVGLVCKLD